MARQGLTSGQQICTHPEFIIDENKSQIVCARCGELISGFPIRASFPKTISKGKVNKAHITPKSTKTEITEWNLKSSLLETREEGWGIPLEKIARIMSEVFDKTEIEFLFKCIQEDNESTERGSN